METYSAIQARKTIREFSSQAIEPDLIEKIIAAGMCAPTNDHMRQWHFILLQDRDKRKELLDEVIHPVGEKGAVAITNRWGLKDPSQREMYIRAIPKQYSMLFNCASLVIPCYRQPGSLLKPKDLSTLNYFASIWCCIENILVAAAAEGIFGVTRIPFESERKVLKEFLHLPEEMEIPCYLALGYPADTAVRAKQVEIDIKARIHLNEW
jgi:nitroreductase